MLRSNPRQGAKEMTVDCRNHVSSIKFSEFGEKKWSIFDLFLMRLSPLARMTVRYVNSQIFPYNYLDKLILWKHFCNLSLHSLIECSPLYTLEQVNIRWMAGSGVYYVYYAHAAHLWVPYIEIGWLQW